MNELTDFLIARIAEDAAAAREAQSVESIYGPDFEITYQWARMTRHRTSHGSGAGFHPGAPSPTRVLAECEAKRHLLDEALVWGEGCLDVMARYMAEVYADHPTYDESWRP